MKWGVRDSYGTDMRQRDMDIDRNRETDMNMEKYEYRTRDVYIVSRFVYNSASSTGYPLVHHLRNLLLISI